MRDEHGSWPCCARGQGDKREKWTVTQLLPNHVRLQETLQVLKTNPIT